MWATVISSAIFMTMIILQINAAKWQTVHDGVMGGISTGEVKQVDDVLLFSGELSLENNGGFASVRRLINADLSDCELVRLLVRGDGRSYQFRFRTDTNFDGLSWRFVFPTSSLWSTVDIPFAGFDPVFRGRKIEGAGPLDTGRISQIGFLLADGIPGPFQLEIRAIDFLPSNCGNRN
jgi:monofunctional biosynthetic peptidoglycan transglycosylase